MATEETAPEGDAAASETPESEDRPLNRAERRAQQHKKKGGGTPAMPGLSQNGLGGGGAGARTGGAGQVRLPRTGHK